MQRRDFIKVVAGSVMAWPLAARAQEPVKPIIGFLNAASARGYERQVKAFLKGLAETGFIDGQNVTIEYRWADGQNDRLPTMAGDLVAQQVDVILAFGDPATRAAQQATKTIPIIAMADDVVGCGLAASLARPGGNTTGVSILASELDAKRLEILHEYVPQARRIAVLADPTTISTRDSLMSAARDLGLELLWFQARNADEIGSALAAIAAAKVEAVNVLSSPLLNFARRLTIDKMHDARLPAIYQWPETAEEGGLLAYGPRNLFCYKLIVSLLDKVLHGAKPADLPIEQPSKFELVVNLKTAETLGMTFSPALLLRADELIE